MAYISTDKKNMALFLTLYINDEEILQT